MALACVVLLALTVFGYHRASTVFLLSSGMILGVAVLLDAAPVRLMLLPAVLRLPATWAVVA